jgi:hypothetical protein
MTKRHFFVAIVVTLLCVFVLMLHAQKPAATSQSWEYKTLVRGRDFQGRRDNDFPWLAVAVEFHAVASNWSVCYEDDKPINCPNMSQKLAQLGSEGWELVGVTPRSSELGSYYQGATTDDLWVFKRQKR